MADPIEIYADTMSGLSVSKDGAIVKFIFSSARPNDTGKVSDIPVLILALPTKAANEMLDDVAKALQASQQPPTGAKN